MRYTFSTETVLLASTFGILVSAAVIDLPIEVHNGYEVVNMNLGTPSKTFKVLFDTGSSTLWVHQAACAAGSGSCPNSSGYKRVPYNSSASSTSYNPDIYANINFLDNTVSGLIFRDIASVGDVAWNQTFLGADWSNWQNLYADGFLGLGFSSIAAKNTTGVFETLVQDGILDETKFSIYYGPKKRTGDQVGLTGGILTLGSSREKEQVQGEMIKLDMVQPYEIWRASISSIGGSRTEKNGSVVDSNLPLFSSTVIFDTGANAILAPDYLIEDMYSRNGFNYTLINNGFRPLCTDFNSSWSVTFTISGQKITLSGEDLANPGYVDLDHCWPPFEPLGNGPTFIFGKQFLRLFYSVFDLGAKEVANYRPSLSLGTLKD